MASKYNQISLDNSDRIFRQIRNAITEQSLGPLFDKLLAQQPILQYGVTRGSFFFRGRKCTTDRGFPSVFDTVYPPASKARVERLNDSGDPLLYASTRALTVL